MSPTPDPDGELTRRLRAELDHVQPPMAAPRYLTIRARPVAWRLAPAAVAVALLGMLALTAYSGSPNPVVWTQHVLAVIHPAATSPAPTKAPDEHRESPDSSRGEPTESPARAESPGPRESPATDDHPSGSGSGDGD